MKMKLTISILLSAVALLAQPVVSNNPPLDANYLPNDGSTGTTLGQWLIMNTSGNAVNAGTTVASGVRGLCITGCGTTGMAGFMQRGVWAALLDNSGTAGDWVVPSGTTAGKGHDTGSATRPTSGVVLGQVQAAAAGGMYYVVLDPPDTVAGAGTVTPSTTDTFTNKTLDAEGTGNVITIPATLWLPGAGCNNATASSFWDLPASTPAVETCVTGTNTQKGVLAFADTSGGFSAQNELLLPDDFTGAIDAKIIWSTGATSGNAKWSLSTVCTAVGASATDDGAYNTASTVTTAAPGTANQLQTSAITSLTATGCTAGKYLHLKIFRDGNDGADTIAATANLVGVELKIRRAM